MATSNRDRVHDEAAWLLHSTPYRETSLVVELFTCEHGRMAAVARGAKRPHSSLRAVLLQFQPLKVRPPRLRPKQRWRNRWRLPPLPLLPRPKAPRSRERVVPPPPCAVWPKSTISI